jgi:hypothetical protein
MYKPTKQWTAESAPIFSYSRLFLSKRVKNWTYVPVGELPIGTHCLARLWTGEYSDTFFYFEVLKHEGKGVDLAWKSQDIKYFKADNSYGFMFSRVKTRENVVVWCESESPLDLNYIPSIKFFRRKLKSKCGPLSAKKKRKPTAGNMLKRKRMIS